MFNLSESSYEIFSKFISASVQKLVGISTIKKTKLFSIRLLNSIYTVHQINNETDSFFKEYFQEAMWLTFQTPEFKHHCAEQADASLVSMTQPVHAQ